MHSRHPSVSPDYELIRDYHADCTRWFWTGVVCGAVIVVLVVAIALLPSHL